MIEREKGVKRLALNMNKVQHKVFVKKKRTKMKLYKMMLNDALI